MMYQLVDDKVEALEFIIKSATEYTGIPLKDLALKPNNLIVCIGRKRQIILLIAKEIRRLLEKEKIEVIMVREKDEELGKSKVEDLKYRVSLMNEKKPSLAVSIHQNSYHEENVFGAQVFYYKTSTEGKKAAAVIQEALQEVNPENTKKIKANDTYYLLKKTEVPTVIVECGFLSNYAEAEKLVSEDYQKKVAEAVTKGILQYLKDQ